MSARLQIGLLVFPRMTQLDMTGPLQVFAALDDADIHLVWKDMKPVSSDTVLTIAPTVSFANCPRLDVICVPGGYGTTELLCDNDVLEFLRDQAKEARVVTSVCTGALVLGAAGLLKGYRAATHWNSRDALPLLGATIACERVCIDRNRITGGGVTAGIDFALAVVAELRDRPTAEAIQLSLEYDPAPPFNAGSPTNAPTQIVEIVREKMAKARAERFERVKLAAARLSDTTLSQ
ncbi:DJ-1/PfpI family protein [Phyllobacterium myrsinacearum]|uniref:Thiamine biosynthesis protein ThiJ n=1 Tax=Phyllobacterium myrsinacearum TaxID=28101 RepID=A0A2S9JP81_9HYPH|nr:DJ-1/PfpI family protein [Phyllobacterium myrsinacearum]PRD55027.1 thiamine biosynthesis protein ThiJ [Phyllobacterium myrsinacearum]PWV90421.1 cyclohexyl-isocyanide hydratase [Phyllobacterium myrsinacearum]RZV05385.1 cyclohexyl-isocyanide hydratase [Phyllobacterium myrsinacearum]